MTSTENRPDAETLFGEGPDAERRYRRLLAETHPDRHAGDPEATRRFQELQALWHTHQKSTRTVLWKGTIHTYTPTGKQREGENHTLHGAGREDGAHIHLKEYTPGHEDLLEAEHTNLHILQLTPEKTRAYYPGTPEKVETDGREALAYPIDAGTWTLAEITARRPYGTDPRDLAWMWRRSLVALGAAHRLDLVHGAVWAENIHILPKEHGVILTNWQYAVPPGTKIPALVKAHRDQYPREVLAKDPASSATDLYMLAQTIKTALDPNSPQALFAHLKACTQPDPRQRPQDPWETLEDLDEILERLYSRRRYRAFTP